MIEGHVDHNLHAMIRIAVFGPTGRHRMVDAIIDTGFNGFLSLPKADLDELGCESPFWSAVRVGDGRLVETLEYAGVVLWNGMERPIRIDAAETDPLVGMGLLKGYRLTIHADPGGRVEII